MTRGLCPAHYKQFHMGNSMTPVGMSRESRRIGLCEFDGCGRPGRAGRLCTGHYQQRWRGQELAPLTKKRANGVVQEMVRLGVVECRGCGEHKSVSQYSKLNATGALRPYCKPCNAERVRLSHYSVTKDFIERLLQFQQGCCAVCGIPHQGEKPMHIDHNHACCSGRRSCGACVRALVCSNCNVYGLAWYEALPAELRTFGLLNSYLSDPPAKRLRAALAQA